MKELLTATGRRIVLLGDYDDTHGAAVVLRDNITTLDKGEGEYVEWVKRGMVMNCKLYQNSPDMEEVFHNDTDEEGILAGGWDGKPRETTWKSDTVISTRVEGEDELRTFLAAN